MNNIDLQVKGKQEITENLSLYKSVVLKPNMVGERNILTQGMVNQPNTKYIVKWEYDLDGATITLEEGCIIEFDGGSFSNGTVVGNETIIIYTKDLETEFNVTKSGTFIYKVSFIPNKEDLDFNTKGELEFADREYDTEHPDGMGYIILRKDKTFAEQIADKSNTIFEIRYDFDLGGESLTMPDNCVLKFNGGKLMNGTLLLSNTIIKAACACLDDVELTGTINNEQIDAIWFGVIGDYMAGQQFTNNDQGLEQLITACKNTGCKMYIRGGKYYFTNPLIFDGSYSINIEGTLVYNGNAESIAITVGKVSEHNSATSFKIFEVEQITQPAATIDLVNKVAEAPNNIGIKLINIYSAEVELISVRNFIYGLIVEADGMGSAYNKLTINRIREAYVSLIINSKNGGWVNENLFVGGRYFCGSNNQFAQVGRNVRITSETNYYNDANTFLKPCFESNHIGVEIEFGNNNSFVEARTEEIPYPMVTKNASNNNVIIPTYGPNGVKQMGVKFGGKSHKLVDLLDNSQICIFDSGDIKYAGNTSNKRYSFTHFYQDEENLLHYDAGAIIENGLISYSFGVPSVAVPVYFNTDQQKDLTITLFGMGRLRIFAYDSNGGRITDLTKLRVENNFLTISSNAYQLGSILPLGNHTFKVSASEDIARLLIVIKAARDAATDPYVFKLGRLAIYSNANAYAPSMDDDNVYLNAIPDVGNVNKVIADTSNTYLTHWDKVSNRWVPSLHYGNTTQRNQITPYMGSDTAGYDFYDSTFGLLCLWDGTQWVDFMGRTPGHHSGELTDLPNFLSGSAGANDDGYMFTFTDDATYGNQIVWWNTNAGGWVDATGTVVIPIS